jgi:hypothetical protein
VLDPERPIREADVSSHGRCLTVAMIFLKITVWF